MAKQKFSVSGAFEETSYVLQLESEANSLRQQIEELRKANSDPAIMRPKLEELQALAQQTTGGIQEIEVSKIQRNPAQPRQTFPAESLQTLALSLQEDGQQQPLILIDNEDGFYLIFDGERRWRASQLMSKTTLAAVIIPKPDKELHRQVLVANLHRENLNGLDVAEALIKELKAVTGLETKEITIALNTALVRLRRYDQHSIVVDSVAQPLEVQRRQLDGLKLSRTEKQIIGTLVALRLNPYTVNSSTFKVLEFPEDLKRAIRDGLPVTHAFEIARLHGHPLIGEEEALPLRAQCIAQIMSQRLSVTATKKLVTTLLPKKEDQEPSAISFAKKISPEGLSTEQRQAVVKLLKQKIKELQ